MAVAKARKVRDYDCNFEGDEIELDESPPWDSADLENWDNDHENRIEVMRVTCDG